MERKIDKKENQDVVITFTANEAEWKAAQDKEFKKLAKKIKVPGFREGHVPEAMAKSKINPAEVMHEAMFALVNKEFQETVKAENLIVFSEPKLEVEKVTETELVANVTFALPPKVELGEYKGIHVEKGKVEVKDEDINAFIENLRNQHATLVVKEDAAALNDTVNIDFKGYVDGVAFDGGEAKGYELKLGSHSFVPGFEEALVGIKSGENKSINVKFPENYVEHLAGKDAEFRITCNEVKTSVLPEVGQELVDELDIKDVTDVESLNKHALDSLTKQKQQEVDNAHLDAIIRQIIDNSNVALSDVLVTDEAKHAIEQIKKQVTDAGLTYEDYLKINNIDESKLLEDKKKEAADNIKAMLVIETICNKENIQVDEKALEAEYQRLAELYNMKLEDVKKALEPNLDQWSKNLKNKLFTDFVLANNQ